MQWWCAAVGVPWSWEWRAYPGVWLFILALIVARVLLGRRAAARDGAKASRDWGWFAAGTLLLWIPLDWPVGALGSGYLASVHMIQFILIGLAAPPLLLLGWPARPAADRAGTRPANRRVITHPLATLLGFTAIVVATHLPQVTDALMPTQAGSFLIDMLWLGAGLLFWWPVLRDTGRAWFGAPARMVYLFASMVLMTAPGAFLTFAHLPVYEIFELAPPVPGVSEIDDQRMAGLNMRVGSAIVIFTAISILFYRWNRAEERLLEAERAESAHPVGPPA